MEVNSTHELSVNSSNRKLEWCYVVMETTKHRSVKEPKQGISYELTLG
jgi:hypothetical protein